MSVDFSAGMSADAARKRGEIMYSTVISGGIRGIYSYLVQVEVDTAQGLPGFEMVGYLGSEVKEAKERVRVALKNAGFAIPAERIPVNISSAEGCRVPLATNERIATRCTDGLIPDR